jgi:hypothetical protein
LRRQVEGRIRLCEKGNVMRPLRHLLLAAALVAPSVAFAAPASPLPSQVRLSDEEKERVLEAAASRNRAPPAARVEVADEARDSAPPIHGEVGFEVGTGGYRSAYGTAVVPLEGAGVAIISLGTSDFGNRRYPEPWWNQAP